MKSKWKVKRTAITRPEGQRRWDYAYQLLLDWAMAQLADPAGVPLVHQEDDQNGNCLICPSFDPTATTEPNH